MDGLWEEVWDEARQCYHFYNPVANIASDTKPLSKHATQLALVDKQVRTHQKKKTNEDLGRMGEGLRPASLMSGRGPDVHVHGVAGADLLARGGPVVRRLRHALQQEQAQAQDRIRRRWAHYLHYSKFKCGLTILAVESFSDSGGA